MTQETKPVEEQVENLTPVEVKPEEQAETITETKEEGAPIPRKHVTDIVKRERLEAYHKAKREFMAEIEALKAQQNTAPVGDAVQANSVSNQGLGGMAQVTPEQVQKMLTEALTKHDEKRKQEDLQSQQYHQAQQVAQNFNVQMANGKAKKPDFDEKMKDVDFGALAPIAHLAANTGIADEIMYDLIENPQKITHLMILAHSQPKMAEREMQKLASSIKMNQQAAQTYGNAKAPLDQITPSAVGTDNGAMSVKDYQKMFM